LCQVPELDGVVGGSTGDKKLSSGVLDLGSGVHSKFPDFFLVSVFDLLFKLCFIDVVEHKIALLGSHYEIFITWKDQKTQNVDLLDILLQDHC
jgi:hypothetical protein